MPTSHATDRLILRKPQQADLEVIFQIHSDPELSRFDPNGPWQSIGDASVFLARWIAHWDEYGFGYWAICANADPGSVIGFGGIMHKVIGGELRLNLYFRFRPEAQGKGYATEMARAAVEMAFGALGHDIVWATVREENTSSRKALERVGLSQCGTLDDMPPLDPHLLYCVQRSA